MEKPTFKSLHQRRVLPVQVECREYNIFPRIGEFFSVLRKEDYGEGYKQGTFGDQFALINGAYWNRTNPVAGQLFQSSSRLFVIGNTASYTGDKLVFAVDEPIVENGNAVMDPKKLEGMLGTKQVRSVVFSDDGRVRAMPRWRAMTSGYGLGHVLESDIPILHTGNEQSPEMINELLRDMGRHCAYLCVPDEEFVGVPVFTMGNEELNLGCYTLDEKVIGCSFGVRNIVTS